MIKNITIDTDNKHSYIILSVFDNFDEICLIGMKIITL